jgi:hypothetical protein
MRSYSRRIRIYGCKLTRSTLDALWRTATQDASDKAICFASSEDGLSKHTAATPEELLSELGSPDRLEDLQLHMYDGGHDGRNMYVLIETHSAWVSVEGPEETWVRGRIQELEDILRRTRVRLAADPKAALPVALIEAFRKPLQ